MRRDVDVGKDYIKMDFRVGSRYHPIGGYVVPRASLDAEVRRKILSPCQGSVFGCPVCG